jgi:Tol biopolymer transport system component
MAMQSSQLTRMRPALLVSVCLVFVLAAVWWSRAAQLSSDGFSSASPDSPRGKINGKILFTSNRDRSLDSRGLRIWAMNADGSSPTELTNEQIPLPSIAANPYDSAPKWSPDGRRIAFLSTRDVDLNNLDDWVPTIYVMDADGSNGQRLKLEQLNSLSPVICTDIESFEWSPDATKFLLNAGSLLTGIGNCPPRVAAEIYTVSADGTNLARLTRDTNPSTSIYFMDTKPTWSPDGTQIAFATHTQNGDGANTIDVMNADGSSRRRIATFSYQDRVDFTSWSPDGSKILFVRQGQSSNCAGHICDDLWVINPDGSQLSQLTHSPASYSSDGGPRWSPDGTKIVFERCLVDPLTHQITDDYAIFVMDADGNNQVNISNRNSSLGATDVQPDWQPLLAPANGPPPSILGLSDGLYISPCSNPSAQIVVMRSGNPDQTVSCDYQIRTENINAGNGTLSFAAGETSKSIARNRPAACSSDTLSTYTISLFNNAGNATFVGGMQKARIVFLGQNRNPVDSAAYFVRQHYRDFLNREPDAAGWDFWTNNIDKCGTFNSPCSDPQRVSTSGSFFLSIEFQQTGYLVERIYKAAFGDAIGSSTINGTHTLRVPLVRFNDFLQDTQEIGDGVVVLQSGWEQKLENNKQSFVNEFVGRSAFTNAYPTSLSPAQFIDRLNTNAGSVLSSTERAQAVALFSGASDTSNLMARAQALRQVAEDQSLYDAEFNRAFVLMQYFGYLRRNPDDAPEATLDYSGYDFWLTKLNQFNGNYINAEMVKASISSSEYRRRFGP